MAGWIALARESAGGGKVIGALLSEAGLVSHAIACFVFAALGLGAARRPSVGDWPSRLLIAASLATALWAFLFVIAQTRGRFAYALLSPAETLRTALWGAFVVSLIVRSWTAQDRPRSSFTVAGSLGLVVVLQFGLDLSGATRLAAGSSPNPLALLFLFSRMTVAIGGLVLVHNLYVNIAPSSRWSVRLLCIGLGGIFGYDLNLYSLQLLTGSFGVDLFNIRGLANALVVPLIAVSASRSHQWRIRLSRQVVFQSFSLVGIGGYLVAMSALGYGLRLVGGDWGRLLQISFIFAAAMLAAVVVFSGQFRAWARVQVNKHFFTSKYDYRQEQRRFVATLSAGEGADGTLAERVIQAVCAIVDSPGGALFTADAEEIFTIAARWNRVLLDVRIALDDPLARYMGEQGRIVNLDELRVGRGDHSGTPAPKWAADRRLWLIVPLIHLDRLNGFIVVERSLAARTLNWEDYDLLRTAGRQAASYIAESASQRALAEARKFDEFNRRFAFIMHDIKNVVSQLSLVARNASKHAGNPEFQADMVLTLNNSVGRMNDLLARLGAKAGSATERPARIDLTKLLHEVAVRKQRLHSALEVRANGPMIVEADAGRLEAAFEHLAQNAIDASEPGDPITLSLAREDGMARVDVIDVGQGMAPDFVRDGLFAPFHSTKDGGFGVGAYEAREIVKGAHGRLSVVSQPGEGSVFTVLLPLAPMAEGRA